MVNSYLTPRHYFFEPVQIEALQKCPELIVDEKTVEKGGTLALIDSYHSFTHHFPSTPALGTHSQAEKKTE